MPDLCPAKRKLCGAFFLVAPLPTGTPASSCGCGEVARREFKPRKAKALWGFLRVLLRLAVAPAALWLGAFGSCLRQVVQRSLWLAFFAAILWLAPPYRGNSTPIDAVAAPSYTSVAMQVPTLPLKLFGAAAYLAWVVHFASDMPFWDDFNIHLHFLNEWLSAPSWRDALKLPFVRNGEHFVLSNKLATAVDYSLFGTLSFSRLILYGNAALVLSLLVIHRSGLVPPVLGFWGFAMALLPQYPQASLWATGSIENFSVLLWAALALSCAGRRPILAFALMSLAAASQGNGALLGCAWALTLALSRRLRPSGCWALASLLLLAPFLLIPATGVPVQSSSLPEKLQYTLVLLGSSVSPLPSISLWVGGVLCAVAVAMTRRLSRIQPEICAFMVWLLMTAAANSVGRAGLGFAYGFEESRYRIVSVLFVVEVVLGAWSISTTRLQRGGISAVAGVCLLSIMLLKLPAANVEAAFRQRDLAEASVRFQYFHTGLSYPNPSAPVPFLLEMRRVGLVELSSPSHESFLPQIEDAPRSFAEGARLAQKLEWKLCSQQYLYLQGYVFDRGGDGTPVVVLSSGGRDYLLHRAADARPDVARHHRRPTALASGISLLVPLSQVGSGPFSVRLGVRRGDGPVLLSRHTASFELGECPELGSAEAAGN